MPDKDGVLSWDEIVEQVKKENREKRKKKRKKKKKKSGPNEIKKADNRKKKNLKKVELYKSLLAKKKERGLNDLYFFNKYIVEQDPKKRKNIVPHVHGEWWEWYKNSDSRIKMILVPRGSFKSTFFTVRYTLQLLCQDRDKRILIANATANNARKFLSEMKDELRTNQELIRLYGKFYDKDVRWNEDEFDIADRTPGIRESAVTAVGAGGNLVSQHYDCLHPKTKILTSNGYENAEDIRKGHRVLTSCGKFYPVEKTIGKESKKKIIKIRPQYQPEPSRFTEDHLIYVWRNGFEWKEAGNLTKEDMLAIPLTQANNRQLSKVNDNINSLILKEDIWRLIGYWLAEGCYTPDGNQIRMTFSDKEIEYVKDVEEIVAKHLGKKISYRKTKNSTYIICFSDNDFKSIIRRFGTKSYTKHIPPYFLNNSLNKQRQLIIGYFRGDGNKTDGCINFTSTSLDLLTGIQLILAKMKIPSGIGKLRDAGKQKVVENMCNVRRAWVLSSTHPMLKVLLGLDADFPKKPIRSFFTKNYWVVPIREIKKEIPSDIVYDIQVKSDHSFYTPGIIAHNCIIGDDLVNDENSATKLQSDKIIDWWKKSLSLLEPSGEYLLIGTRWSYYELYSYLLDKFEGNVDTYIRSVYNEDDSLYFPERYTKSKLRELKKLHGSYFFSAFYLNNPVDEESALIKRSQIQYYEDHQKPRNMKVFSCCDPAISQSTDSDYSSITTVGVDVNDDWYVLEVRRGKWTVGELINELFSVYKRHRPENMTIEVVGQAQGLLNPILKEEERRQEYLPLQEVKARPQVTKETRIRSILQPRFEQGKIYIKRSMDELVDELLNFPKGRHDDIIDALTDVEEISFTPENDEEEFFGDKTLTKLENKLKYGNTKKLYDPIMGEHF